MKMVMKKSGKKGFTLAELLIVVAIIGVLVGISIPIFTTQLQKSRVATNQANARAAKAAAVAAYLNDETNYGGTYHCDTGVFEPANAAVTTKISGDNISSWDASTATGETGKTMGSDTYDTWIVAIGEDSNSSATDKPIVVTGYACS